MAGDGMPGWPGDVGILGSWQVRSVYGSLKFRMREQVEKVIEAIRPAIQADTGASGSALQLELQNAGTVDYSTVRAIN